MRCEMCDMDTGTHKCDACGGDRCASCCEEAKQLVHDDAIMELMVNDLEARFG